MLQHAFSIIFHEMVVLDLEVSEQFVRSPLPNKSYHFGVNASIEKSIDSCCTEAVGRYVSSKESKCRSQVSNSILQHHGYIGRGDRIPSLIGERVGEGSLR